MSIGYIKRKDRCETEPIIGHIKQEGCCRIGNGICGIKRKVRLETELAPVRLNGRAVGEPELPPVTLNGRAVVEPELASVTRN